MLNNALFCDHEYLRRFGRRRLYLECRKCGRTTRGIEVGSVTAADARDVNRKGQAAASTAPVLTLVIVRRGELATFEQLSRDFANDPSVQVIWDRRRSDRRQTWGQRSQERRVWDRRVSNSSKLTAYRIVHTESDDAQVPARIGRK